MSDYYPICLSVKGRKCLVVGGGQVALRKVSSLLESEAVVEVVSPRFCQELADLAHRGLIRAVERPYQSADLETALLVIAATDDPAVNRTVSADCLKSGTLINVVDKAVESTFILPASLQRGDLNIAVSTSGRSPALARKLRTTLEKQFGPEYGTLALLLDDIRNELKRRSIQVDPATWQAALDLEWLSQNIRLGQTEMVKKVVLDNLVKNKTAQRGA